MTTGVPQKLDLSQSSWFYTLSEYLNVMPDNKVLICIANLVVACEGKRDFTNLTFVGRTPEFCEMAKRAQEFFRNRQREFQI